MPEQGVLGQIRDLGMSGALWIPGDPLLEAYGARRLFSGNLQLI